MLLKLFLLFTIVPVVELTLLIEVGSIFGSIHTIGMVILTGIAGAYISRRQGINVVQKITIELNAGRFPADDLFDGLFILGGGLLLLTPGFLTDALGFSFLLPPTRVVYKKILQSYVSTVFKQEGNFHIKHVGSSF